MRTTAAAREPGTRAAVGPVTAATESPADPPVLAYLGLSCMTCCWTAGFILGKLVLADFTPLATAALRYAFAIVVLLPFAVRARPRGGLGRAARPLAVMVLTGGILYPWLFLLALSRTTATNTSLLIALNPVFTMLLAPLGGEPFDRRRLGGIVLALAGAATVITGGDPAKVAALSFAQGDLVAVTAAAVWATFNVASRGVAGRLAAPFANGVIYGTGALALGALGWSERPLAQLAAAPATAIGGVAAMALLSSVIAGQLFLTGVRQVGVARTVVFVYVVPVLTALASAALLGERLHASQAVGGAAVLTGIWWTSRARARP